MTPGNAERFLPPRARGGWRLLGARRVRPWLVLWMALAGVSACSSKTTVIVSGDDDAGATTTSTASVTTTTTGTDSTTSSTTTPPCPADLTAAVGASAACNACLGETCCAQAEAFAATLDQASYEDLLECAVGVGGVGPCAEPCVSAVCSSEYVLAFYQSCAECQTASCCVEFDACAASSACDECLWTGGDECCSNGLFLGWDQCRSGPCGDECGLAHCGAGS
jgi:hypothetical protein